jgi:predicted 3-demethylubiquinone-9 3-methyltransferase (glyoxalase superfamily)
MKGSTMATQKITPFLWFENQAEEAARFYTTVFRNSKMKDGLRYDDEASQAAGRPKGTVMTVAFELDGQEFVALNGGPHFKFNEAISFVIHCENQEEVDHYWSKLGEGGDPKSQQCGWLKDKFGVSWQVVPTVLDKLLADKDPQRSKRAMHAMLQMKKLDIDALIRAADGR